MSRLARVAAARVCVIKPSALGDVVQAMPLLRVLRRRFPRAEITWVIASGLSDLVHPHPLVDRVIRFERRGGWRDWRRLLGELRVARFDLVFDLQGLARTGLMTAATGAPVRIGLESAREGASLAVHRTIPDSGRRMPAHARYWRVAEELGLGEQDRSTPIAVSRSDAAFAASVLPAGRLKMALVPGAKWVTKRWPPEKFARLAVTAFRKTGALPVVVGAPDEVDLCGEVMRTLLRLAPGCGAINLAGGTTLRQLAAVLAGCDLAVSNDTGPMHLAAAVGTPVVGIFTCTDPIRSGPPGPRHELVQTAVACAGSYKKQCPIAGAGRCACLEDVQVAAVWEATIRCLRKNGLIRPAGPAKTGRTGAEPILLPFRHAA
ncbi:glycosyltransferase family 9 protein [Alienimonas sp. DA493]|uniref:glycosyltransferase family 9 protein n=1 Tax=Alienimonas sp. DA493 TaxID=3373605 RepID=UPI00375453DA